MPPVTRGARGRGIPNANAEVGRGRGRGRGRGQGIGRGRGQDRQDRLDDEIPHDEDQGGIQVDILQQILGRLDGIEARNINPGGGANNQHLRIPNVNQMMVMDPVIRTQLKDISKLKGPYFNGTEAGNEAES